MSPGLNAGRAAAPLGAEGGGGGSGPPSSLLAIRTAGGCSLRAGDSEPTAGVRRPAASRGRGSVDLAFRLPGRIDRRLAWCLLGERATWPAPPVPWPPRRPLATVKAADQTALAVLSRLAVRGPCEASQTLFAKPFILSACGHNLNIQASRVSRGTWSCTSRHARRFAQWLVVAYTGEQGLVGQASKSRSDQTRSVSPTSRLLASPCSATPLWRFSFSSRP